MVGPLTCRLEGPLNDRLTLFRDRLVEQMEKLTTQEHLMKKYGMLKA